MNRYLCRYCAGLGVEKKMKSNGDPRWCRMGCIPQPGMIQMRDLSIKKIKFGKKNKLTIDKHIS